MASNEETTSLLGKSRDPDPHTDTGYGTVGPQVHAGTTGNSPCRQSTNSSGNSGRHLRPESDDFSDVTFPSYWEPMRSKTVIGVPVDPSSEEGIFVDMMFRIGSDIVVTNIIRIQNPRLWAHYCRKRRQMEGERLGRGVREAKLFHGTAAPHVDSICRKGFEVGRAGKSFGHRLGKGIYFARDSITALRYATPLQTLKDYPQIMTSPLIAMASMDTRQFHDINYDQGWGAAHPLLSSMECSISEGEMMVFDHQHGKFRGGYEVYDIDEQDDNAEVNVSAIEELPSLGTAARSQESQSSLENGVGDDTLPRAEHLRKKTVPNASFSSNSQDTVLQLESAEEEAPRPSTSATQDTVVQIQCDDDEAPGPSVTSRASAQQRTTRKHRSKVVPRKTIGSPPHYMFLASVLVGHSAPAQESYVMPPLMNPARFHGRRRYDSCVGGNPFHPVYVVFRNNQVYPEYLIEYERKSLPLTERLFSTKYMLGFILIVCIVLVVLLGTSRI